MRLKQLEVHGFKTFANRMTFKFNEGITAIVGPNGSGKCVSGETLVTLADGQEVQIRELVEAALHDSHVVEQLDDGSITHENPYHIQILSLNPDTLRLEPRSVAAFVKRQAPSRLLRVRTRACREITATPYHPFFTLVTGQLCALKAEELQEGVRIALPRNLPVSGGMVSLEPFEVLQRFTAQDQIFAPNSKSLRAWADNARSKFGTWAKWRQAAQVPPTQFSGLLDHQAVNAATLVKLANAASTPPPLDGRLKSHAQGELQLPTQFTPDLARFLGLLVAEGRNTDSNQVWFVNSDPAVNDNFERLARTLFGTPVHREYYRPNAADNLIYSHTLGQVLERLFNFPVGSNSAEKQVPPQLFRASAETQWSFLSGLFEGDAYVCVRPKTQDEGTTAFIEYATASEVLARQVVSLLLRLGVFALLRAKEKYASNTAARQRRIYYSVFIYGTEQLRYTANHLSFYGEKANALLALRQLDPASNPNLDLIPDVTPLVKAAAKTAGVQLKPNRHRHLKLAAYMEQRCEASRGGLLQVIGEIEELGSNSVKAYDILDRLKILATSDIYWDSIVSIETVSPSDEWVYDLSIAGTHNFVAGNVIVHNSNVADGIRWALGEQSYSTLRTKKTEDIIFAGSSLRPRMGMAEVALTLENPFALAEPEPTTTNEPNGGDGSAMRPRANVVEEILKARPTEVTVMRRAYRSGENEYFINQQRVRLRDLQELLQHWGLSRNTYAVVGQGLIDAALSLRAEERRALFEEAAGIGLYQSKKQSALEKLEETQQNLLRANDIINEIAPRLPSLARQADRANRYEGVTTALNEKLRQWYAYQWAQAQEHYARSATTEQEAREKLNAQRGQMHDLGVQLAETRRQAQVLRGKLAEQRRARTARQNDYAARERELAVLDERLHFAEQQGDEALREIRALESSAESHGPRLAAAQARRVELEHQRARIIARKRLAEGRMVEMETARASAPKGMTPGDVRDLARRLVELKPVLPLYEQSLPALARLSARAEALAHHELTRREREQLLERARGELNEAKTALALIERDIQAAQLAIDNALEAQKQATAQVEAKRARQENLARQTRSLANQRDQLRTVVEAFAQELQRLTAEASPEEASLADSERRQNELEEQEVTARSELTRLEEIYNRTVLDAERSRAEIARLESEIEDDLGTVELDSQAPQQLRLRLVYRRAGPADPSETARDTAAGEEVETSPEAEEQELVVLPEVRVLPDGFDKEIRRLKNQMKYIGNVNPNAPAEYAELKQRHAFLTEQAADLVQAIERLHRAVAELDELMQERFKETFDAINAEFKRYFNLLFGGGTARLELTDPDNLIQSGIEIIARPPGKRAAHLAILSGGERSLTACSLLFAIFKASPTPFCVLDEVDAMLDEANVGRFRDALKELGSESQFIVITHNRATIESANTVYGISMGDDGVSQVISMRLAEAATETARAG